MKPTNILGCGVLLAASAAHAGQFLLADDTFTHQASEGSHHHAHPLAGVPTNLASPTDYRQGSVHIRVDLTMMASTKGLHWLLTLEQGPDYVCVGPQKQMLTPGTYEWDVPVSQFQCLHPAYDYGKPPATVSYIIRDTHGVKIDPGNAFDGAPDLTLYFPLTSHVRVWLVSNGATFQQPPTDGGTPSDAGVHDGGTAHDAGVMSDGGELFDAGESFDGGAPDDDAGFEPEDAGAPPHDGGTSREPTTTKLGGCSMGVDPSVMLGVWLMLAFGRPRRRH